MSLIASIYGDRLFENWYVWDSEELTSIDKILEQGYFDIHAYTNTRIIDYNDTFNITLSINGSIIGYIEEATLTTTPCEDDEFCSTSGRTNYHFEFTKGCDSHRNRYDKFVYDNKMVLTMINSVLGESNEQF